MGRRRITESTSLQDVKAQIERHAFERNQRGPFMQAAAAAAAESVEGGVCRGCGCIERTGEPCAWVEPDLCSACALPGFSP